MILPAPTGERPSPLAGSPHASAEADYRNILRWTAEQFGTQQARRYARTPECAIAELTERPDVPGSRERPDIGPGIRVLHVARHGRRGRHFLLYRISSDEELLLIDVLRVLHDRMDLPSARVE